MAPAVLGVNSPPALGPGRHCFWEMPQDSFFACAGNKPFLPLLGPWSCFSAPHSPRNEPTEFGYKSGDTDPCPSASNRGSHGQRQLPQAKSATMLGWDLLKGAGRGSSRRLACLPCTAAALDRLAAAPGRFVREFPWSGEQRRTHDLAVRVSLNWVKNGFGYELHRFLVPGFGSRSG